jgi:predicted RNA-binding protein YlqC (UPF0109 family)
VSTSADEGGLEPSEELDDYNRIHGAMAKAVLDYLARNIVDDPDSVVIEVDEGRRGDVRLSLHVAPDDMGKVIGRRGRTAQAIRAVVRAAGARESAEVVVDIVD